MKINATVSVIGKETLLFIESRTISGRISLSESNVAELGGLSNLEQVYIEITKVNAQSEPQGYWTVTDVRREIENLLSAVTAKCACSPVTDNPAEDAFYEKIEASVRGKNE